MNEKRQQFIEKTLDFINNKARKLQNIEFLHQLTKYLGELFQVDYVLIDKYDIKKPNIAETISVYNRNSHIHNITYDLKDTPCENVMGTNYCCYETNVQNLFPKDDLLVEMNVDSYLGIPLWSTSGVPIGLIAIMDKNSLKNTKTIELVFKIIAIKTSQVLEKILFENTIDIYNKNEGILKKQISAFETFVLHENGSHIPVEITGKIIKYKNKTVGVGTIRDITERKKTEKIIKENEKKQRIILNTFKDGIKITTPDYKIYYANSALQKRIGRNPVGEDCFKAIYNLDKKCSWCIYEKLKNEKKDINYELNLKKGNIYEVNNILLDNSNKLTVYQDVTERKQSEEALKESENKFKTITSAAGEAIILMNNKGDIDFWNKAAEKIFGYTEKEISNKNLHKIIVPKKYLQTHYKTFPIFQKTGKGAAVNKTVELEGKRKNGEIFPIELTISAIQIKGKWNAIGIVKDITERKNYEQSLKKAKQAADTANRLKSEFLANMSHEIRTPMTAILGFSDILKGRLKDEKQIKFANIIHKSGNNLLELINDILDLSKIEAGQIKIQKESANIRVIFKDINLTFAEIVERKNIKFNLEISENIPARAIVDRFRIRQVLLNLVSNAVKFTEDGSVTVFVETLSGQKKDAERFVKLIIKVIDTGIGIPEKDIGIIFDSFRQVDGQETRKYGGTGLGLAITKKLVELLDGTISVKSKVGEGTTFTVEINNIEIDEKDIKEIDKQEFSEIKINNANILHVEDNKDIRDMVELIFENDKINIEQVETGKQALEVLKKYTPDIILMDIQLPEVSGVEITKNIRKNDKLRNVPIIALTAHATTEEIDKFSPFFDDYITKPINKNLLKEIVSKHLT